MDTFLYVVNLFAEGDPDKAIILVLSLSIFFLIALTLRIANQKKYLLRQLKDKDDFILKKYDEYSALSIENTKTALKNFQEDRVRPPSQNEDSNNV